MTGDILPLALRVHISDDGDKITHFQFVMSIKTNYVNQRPSMKCPELVNFSIDFKELPNILLSILTKSRQLRGEGHHLY